MTPIGRALLLWLIPLAVPFFGALLLPLGCTASFTPSHEAACLGDERAREAIVANHEALDHIGSLASQSPRTGEVASFFLARELLDHYSGAGTTRPSRVLDGVAEAWRHGPPMEVERYELVVVERGVGCDHREERVGRLHVARCGNALEVRPSDSASVYLGFIDPETGYFAVHDPEVGGLIGFLDGDRVGYGLHGTWEAFDACGGWHFTSMFFRPDGSCPTEYELEGLLRTGGGDVCPGHDFCCLGGPARLTVRDGLAVLDFDGRIVSGRVDALCRVHLESDDGLERWDLACSERNGLCTGWRYLTRGACVTRHFASGFT